jgi:hypothetical protein
MVFAQMTQTRNETKIYQQPLIHIFDRAFGFGLPRIYHELFSPESALTQEQYLSLFERNNDELRKSLEQVQKLDFFAESA